MRSGIVPASMRRNARCVSTCVLPVPALALTQAELRGSAASRCARLVRSRSLRGRCIVM